jgi:hypothetical protein
MQETLSSPSERHNLDQIVAVLMQTLSEGAFRNLLKDLDAFHLAHVPDEVWVDPEAATQRMDEGQTPWQTSVDNPQVAEIRERLVSVFGLPRNLTDDEILELKGKFVEKARVLGFEIN